MIAASLDLQAERWELIRLGAAILQPVLLIGLAAGLVLASAHLITMLGTRWGRRRVSQKALAFSLLVHVSLICGILALWPEAATGKLFTERWRHDREPEPVPEAFRLLPDTAVATTRAGDSSSASPKVWEQLPDPFRMPAERTPLEMPDAEESALPRPESDAPPEIAMTEPAPLPAADLPLPAPESAQAPSQDPLAPDLQVDVPQPEARPDAEPPSIARERAAPSPDSIARLETPDALQRPEMSVGPAPVRGPEKDRLPTSVLGVQDEQAELQDVPDEAADVVRTDGPANVELPVPQVATSAADSAGDTADNPLRPSVRRERTVSPGSAQATADRVPDVERIRPDTSVAAPEMSRDPLPLSDSLATTEQPRIELPGSAGPVTSSEQRVPAPYRLRGADERAAATKRYGGNADSERAVELSLKWLAENQTLDGFWDASEHGGGSTRSEGGQTFADVGKEADTGLTGLALLAFLGRGHTLHEGAYSANVERGIRWLVAQQRADGALGGKAGVTDFVYCHAMATFALAEAYALSDKSASEWLRLPVQKAVQYTLDTMTPDGGWRYQKGQAYGDMSIFGWQLMALKSAELAGITIPKVAEDRMVQFLIARSLGRSGGLAGYRPGDRPTPSMTAEALYCKQRLGISRENPACAEAIAFLEASPPQLSQANYYYWYYGSLSMRQYGGEPWERWNSRLRDLLIQEQRKSGPLAGSWDPRDPWGPYGGRIYSTALATLCLEVYYRYGQDE